MKHLLFVPMGIICFVLGFLVFPLSPKTLRQRLRPQPWSVVTFYDYQPPQGWKIIDENDFSDIGDDKIRTFASSFRFDDSYAGPAIASIAKASHGLIKEHHEWAYINQIQIHIDGKSSWRDVDALVDQGLSHIGSRSPKPVHDARLNNAAAIWSRALGRTVAVPNLYYGSCPGLAIWPVACADSETYTITLVDQEFQDLPTIYLHEIGHLLGVSHIPGDVLMDPEYSRPCSYPTKSAIEQAQHRHIDESKSSQ